MRDKHRNDPYAARAENARYCVLCETVMLFERVETGDPPDEDLTSEWICVACGSALLVGSPQHHRQPEHHQHRQHRTA